MSEREGGKRKRGERTDLGEVMRPRRVLRKLAVGVLDKEPALHASSSRCSTVRALNFATVILRDTWLLPSPARAAEVSATAAAGARHAASGPIHEANDTVRGGDSDSADEQGGIGGLEERVGIAAALGASARCRRKSRARKGSAGAAALGRAVAVSVTASAICVATGTNGEARRGGEAPRARTASPRGRAAESVEADTPSGKVAAPVDAAASPGFTSPASLVSASSASAGGGMLTATAPALSPSLPCLPSVPLPPEPIRSGVEDVRYSVGHALAGSRGDGARTTASAPFPDSMVAPTPMAEAGAAAGGTATVAGIRAGRWAKSPRHI